MKLKKKNNNLTDPQFDNGSVNVGFFFCPFYCSQDENLKSYNPSKNKKKKLIEQP